MVSKTLKRYGWLTFVIISLCVSIALYLLGFGQASSVVLLVMSVVSLGPELHSIVRDLRKGSFGVDILAVVAVVAALAMQQYPTAAVIVLMFTGGKSLEDYALTRAQKQLTELLSKAPKVAHRKRGKAFVEVATREVVVGDILLVKPGETIPVDGVIVSGKSDIDESSITGESLTVTKKRNDKVLSGTVNLDIPLQIRAKAIAKDSQYQHIVALVKKASESKTGIVRLADRYAVPFTALAFVLAGVAWAVSGSPERALAVLVVATPCPLLIATPVAIVSAMSRAAKEGIIVKDGASLERLSRAKTMAFDKTGTLTSNTPKLQTVNATGVSERELLTLVLGVEQYSSHIFATALIAEGKSRRLKVPTSHSFVQAVGSGASAVVLGKTIRVGSRDFLKQYGVVSTQQASSQSTIYVAQDKTYIGSITFADPLRPDAKKTLKSLYRLGIKKTLILTGDKAIVSKRIAQDLGITEVHSELLPAQKLEHITRLKKSGFTAMVGDGVNDAPTLAAADVGVALGAKGSTAATESADVVILPNTLYKVATGVGISRHAIRIALQSIGVGIGLSIVLMLFAATGHIPPFVGALLQEVVDVVVILNALRAYAKIMV